jgi:phosphatidylglycerophosphate synthase
VLGVVVTLAGVLVIAVLVGHGLRRAGRSRPGPADVVTLTRVTLAAVVAGLTAAAFVAPRSATPLVALATVALALDWVDGRVARSTRTATDFGARFDQESDAFLILVLSAYDTRLVGPWVLGIGLARYAFVAAGWLSPVLRRPLPARYWRKVVAAVQGIALTVVATGGLPTVLAVPVAATAGALLAESFGRDIWWLVAHRRRPAPLPVPARVPVGAAP